MTKLGKSFVFALVALLVCFGVAMAGYLVSKVIGDVTVVETITVTPATFTMELVPNDKQVQNVNIRNSGSTDVEVTVGVSVLHSSGGVGVSLDVASPTISVAPHSRVVVPVVVTTTNGVLPGEFVITVTVER